MDFEKIFPLFKQSLQAVGYDAIRMQRDKELEALQESLHQWSKSYFNLAEQQTDKDKQIEEDKQWKMRGQAARVERMVNHFLFSPFLPGTSLKVITEPQ